MTDQEIIIASLLKVQRRLRANRLRQDLSFALSLFLLFPLAFKLCDLFVGFTGTTVVVAVGMWFLALASYCLRLLGRKSTLAHAAASIDKRVALNDELKTAYWFIENPRPSTWVDVQIQRAATSAQKLDVDRLYPRSFPRTLYMAAAILLLLVGLNFIPTSLNHNWLTLEAAPSSTLTKADLDLADIAAGLEEIARDLQEARQTEQAGDALFNKDLVKAAAELRKVATNMETISPEELLEMQLTLDEASENSRPGLEELSQDLKRAATSLKKREQRETEEALEQAAQELEQLGERIEAQLARNASRQPARNPRGNVQGAAGGGDGLQQVQQGAGWDTPLPDDRRPLNAPPGNAPMGLEPSGDAVPNPPRLGPPTTLKVQLEREKLESQLSPLKQNDLEKASKEERSKIDYHDVPSDLRAAQKDVLNQDWIPSRYRDLIRNYFHAIRPPE